MVEGFLLVVLEGASVRSLFVDDTPTGLPWAPGVRVQADGDGVRVAGAAGAPGRILPGQAVPLGGRLASCHPARRTLDGGTEARMGPTLVAASDGMLGVFHLVAAAAGAREPVLILGESGTGKELLARSVHDLGSGASSPFVAVNVAALPFDLVEAELFGWMRGSFTGAADSRAGAFEMAAGGTIFLDEVAEAPASAQAKLLRVVETGAVRRIGSVRTVETRARIVAATNVDPAQAVARGDLRLDLLQRLACLVLRPPPLRARPVDIGVIARAACDPARGGSGIDGAAIEVLKAYAWPGNVRELRNVLRRAEVLCGGSRLGAAAVREAISAGRLGEGTAVVGVRERNACDRRRQIEESGLPRSTFYYRLKKGRIPAAW